MFTFYHNPRCKISRETLVKLQSSTQEDINVIDYTKTKFTHKQLSDLINLLNIEPLDLIRKKEAIFNSNYKNKKFSKEEWIQIMVENYKLIERPIVVKNYKGVICRPPEKVFELTSK
jgi:arsenate reductase